MTTSQTPQISVAQIKALRDLARMARRPEHFEIDREKMRQYMREHRGQYAALNRFFGLD